MAEASHVTAEPAATRGARRRTETRRRLLAAARVVFAREGLEAATVAQITAGADTGFGTFYLHFATKEEAYRAVITEGFDELAATLERVRAQAAARGAPWPALARASIRSYCEFAAQNRELSTIMFSGGAVGLGLSRELQERFAIEIAAHLIQSETATDSDPHPWPYPPKPVAIATIAAITRMTLWWLSHEGDTRDAGDRTDQHQSFETLIETLSRYVIAALWGQVPG